MYPQTLRNHFPEPRTDTHKGGFTMALYIGLMSGTSADAIDVALADFSREHGIRQVASLEKKWTEEDRKVINSLCVSGNDEIHRAGLFGCRYARMAAEGIEELLRRNHLSPKDIRAIASHGQTVRHEPQNAFSVQLGNHALLAALTGIDVTCDFRAMDLALNGQGAPLVPAFHREVCASPDVPRYIVNIGGISNVSVLIPGHPVVGFDTGPGNTMIDLMARTYLNASSDFDGACAAAGNVDIGILEELLNEPYFEKEPPKSTGRELFNADYLKRSPKLADLSLNDRFATVTELTAVTVINGINRFGEKGEIYVCGGGCHNGHLMRRLASHAAESGHLKLACTSEIGVDPDYLEAVAFAWLGYKFINGESVDMTGITGASRACIMGALYPAPK